MNVSDFTLKIVPGLYNFDHFEAPNGAFIQRSAHNPAQWVYQDAEGKRSVFTKYADLKAAVEA